ncbi:sulfatase-like hydrolase/transferase [Candidatus Sulfurimonas marisnigri]|uniref:Sulfatase-like hydrolase/transferase n=1 Tax=Candidatus Sulfurimonas marisnigri TaxID=2740405 RepID=A0A7S7M1A5_9BACT|nr:alkaline phosphatase family protein [Candidatus Sulfurimonas marisnigri]QOY55222.1 sulfatase-like hydrolase/transferase [Candidatus Sulfurimonas marisnigri]
MYLNLPKHLKFLLFIVLIEVLVLTLLRVAFFTAFWDNGLEYSSSEVAYSFWLGLRFDIQLIAIVNLPILLFGGIKRIGIFEHTRAKYFWMSYLMLTIIAIINLYVINFAYYDFFQKLVDSTIIRYFYNIKTAMSMLIDGYPIFSTSAGVVIFLLFILFVFNNMYKKVDTQEAKLIKGKKKFYIYALFSIIYIFSGYGKFEWYPWRWSEAFYSSNNFLSYLASNPVTYFSNTLKNKDIKYDEQKTKEYYDYVAELLNIKDKDPKKLSLARIVKPEHKQEYKFDKPNIVYILGESTSYARTSMSGNPLNPTPFLKEMSDSGILYNRYYTPHAGTARSVWTSMTGLTDVERMKTSTRNPMVVNQNMILNSLNDYEKFYFIGGSLSWGNIRGVISNVNDIHIYEEPNYKDSPSNDAAWGISDVHLVSEVNNIIKKVKKPFFAFVQLSGNHSPNTIPDENFGFEYPKNLSKEDMNKYSFSGGEDDFAGQKFLDHSVERFITLAKKEKYFDNTIFIFVGDHGLAKRGDHMHQAEQVFLTATLHTPLIIYAPKLIKHKEVDYPVSAVDIMATIGGLSGQKYINSTMGRDLLDKEFDEKAHYAYYMDHGSNPTLSLMGDEFIFRIQADGTKKRLYKYYYDKKDENLISIYPEVAKKMEKTCRGIFESTRYVRFNNSTADVEKCIELSR